MGHHIEAVNNAMASVVEIRSPIATPSETAAHAASRSGARADAVAALAVGCCGLRRTVPPFRWAGVSVSERLDRSSPLVGGQRHDFPLSRFFGCAGAAANATLCSAQPPSTLTPR